MALKPDQSNRLTSLPKCWTRLNQRICLGLGRQKRQDSIVAASCINILDCVFTLNCNCCNTTTLLGTRCAIYWSTGASLGCELCKIIHVGKHVLCVCQSVEVVMRDLLGCLLFAIRIWCIFTKGHIITNVVASTGTTDDCWLSHHQQCSVGMSTTTPKIWCGAHSKRQYSDVCALCYVWLDKLLICTYTWTHFVGALIFHKGRNVWHSFIKRKHSHSTASGRKKQFVLLTQKNSANFRQRCEAHHLLYSPGYLAKICNTKLNRGPLANAQQCPDNLCENMCVHV